MKEEKYRHRGLIVLALTLAPWAAIAAAFFLLAGCSPMKRANAVDENGCRWVIEYQWTDSVTGQAHPVTDRDGNQICRK